MEYQTQTGALADLSGHCLVCGLFANGKLTPTLDELDQASGGKLGRLLKSANLRQAGDSLLLHELPGIQATRVLLLCLGEKKDYQAANYRKALFAAIGLLQGDKSREVTWVLDLPWPGAGPYELARDAVLAAEEAVYRPDACKSKQVRNKAAPSHPLRTIHLWHSGADADALERGLRHGKAIAEGMRLAKDLANLPGNLCTPSYLAEQALALGKGAERLEVTVLDEQEMARLGMGALLSVAKGSREPPRLIVLRYRGGKPDERPIALVGKGLTFDAGGISLKPGEAMDEMKYDMCGGASVLGALQACAELALPLNLVGLVPATENLPDGNANKPGDIVTSLSGQTIEILNTDAEGRLILCDALTYGERFEPVAVIDIATLTGACVIALGAHASGLLANDQPLADELLAAGQAIGDRAWQLPLWDDYQQQLDSNFADMANIGGRPAGSITAACFLSRFTKKLKWAHLDIAGTAWKSGKEKGATGRPVPLLVEFLLRRAGVR